MRRGLATGLQAMRIRAAGRRTYEHIGNHRQLHASRCQAAVKPFLLVDVGEGIREVQIIQWFVKEGARIAQFDPIVEVQHDKASVEVTSRFDGIVKRLHYDVDDIAQVGQALVDIDVQGEDPPEGDPAAQADPTSPEDMGGGPAHQSARPTAITSRSQQDAPPDTQNSEAGTHRTLATPAVRHLSKQHDLDIATIVGSGRDGRVLKEDVMKAVEQRGQNPSASSPSASDGSPSEPGVDSTIFMTPRQTQMLRAMSKSLSIPHFLYSDAVDMGRLTALRKDINVDRPDARISALAFILKATSMAVAKYPIMNAKLDVESLPTKPQIRFRVDHNFGVAVDTPDGLLVPVIRRVQGRSISSLAAEIKRISMLGRQGQLTPNDLSGGTFTISNVGSIGGGVVSPVIVEGQTSIVGVGRARIVPAFDDLGQLIQKEECVFSWSADHRIVDGATVARCAEEVRRLLESPSKMLVDLS